MRMDQLADIRKALYLMEIATDKLDRIRNALRIEVKIDSSSDSLLFNDSGINRDIEPIRASLEAILTHDIEQYKLELISLGVTIED